MYGLEEKRIRCFGGGNLRGRDNLEDPGVDADNIKMDLQEQGWWYTLN